MKTGVKSLQHPFPEDRPKRELILVQKKLEWEQGKEGSVSPSPAAEGWEPPQGWAGKVKHLSEIKDLAGRGAVRGPGCFWKALEAPRTLQVGIWNLKGLAGWGTGCIWLAGRASYLAHPSSKG